MTLNLKVKTGANIEKIISNKRPSQEPNADLCHKFANENSRNAGVQQSNSMKEVAKLYINREKEEIRSKSPRPANIVVGVPRDAHKTQTLANNRKYLIKKQSPRFDPYASMGTMSLKDKIEAKIKEKMKK
jgi:flavorubredoxin